METDIKLDNAPNVLTLKITTEILATISELARIIHITA
jgi:hypothetical protein